MVEANRVVPIPLEEPTENEHDRLQQTRTKYQYCQHRAADYCWNDPTGADDLITSKRTVESALYDDLREETDGLHANLVQKAFKDVTDAMRTLQTKWQKGKRISKPEWDRDGSWAMTYDKRAGTFSKYEVTLATVGNVVTLKYQLPAELEETLYKKYVLDNRWEFATSELVYRHGKYWLHLGVKRNFSTALWTERVDEEVSDAPKEDAIRVLGVDLNVNGHTAVTSAAGFHGNADYLNHRREEFEALRSELQQTATRSAYLRFQECRGVESAWFDEYAHLVANGIVDDALRVKATHVVFEKLDGIRDRMANRPKYQDWMFKKVRTYVEYKLEPYGVDIVSVNPRNTSKQCSHTQCQHIAAENRAGKEFECTECGLALNADYNASRNIGLRYLEKRFSTGRTRQAEKATCQLALVSGTLSVSGEFSPMDWVSTDKPTDLLVGS